ncbi:MAG: hypothetical protein HRU69_10665 [Flammeovirgaceae bacterium]|nr:MAG: hypothetical protein HRU69_10665 [Flammeovirgaceae bacterium]
MDDSILYYIIIGAIYLIYNWLKAKKQPDQSPTDYEPPTGRSAPSQPQSKPRPLTFEELLKEITEAKQPVNEPVAEYKRTEPVTQEYVDYDDEVADEEELVEQETERAYDFKKESTYKQFEEAKQQAFYRKSLEETTRLEDVKMDFGRFKEFNKADQRNLLEEYTRDLRDPEGFKKALILSEILNRKHF